MKAVVLLGAGDDLPTWQCDALALAIEKGLDIVVVAHCLNDRRPRRTRKHSAYHALTRSMERQLLEARPTNIRPLLPAGVEEVSFLAGWNGGGQRIPSGVSEGFRGADVVVNLGMSHLASDEDLPVTYGVLSYVHGDVGQLGPRLCSFYAMDRGEQVQPVTVQRLSAARDDAEVLARGYGRVLPYSYAKTAREACLAGVPLLAKAISRLEKEQPGWRGAPARRVGLPANTAVVRRAAGLGREKAGRLAYGLVRQPRWQAARLAVPLSPEEHVTVSPAAIEPLAMPDGYYFAADTFAAPDGGLYCELLHGRTGVGEIALWREGAWSLVDLGLGGGHASYPQPVQDGGSLFLLPEISFVSSPALFRLEADGLTVSERVPLEGLEGIRLHDATLFKRGETWYLFGGHAGSAESRLDLWTARELTGPYRLHPASPVCLDPRGARMAGPIAEINGRVYRFGQDNSGSYGGRVTVHRIDALTEDAYEESVSGSLVVGGRDLEGPHTVSVGEHEVWIDFFEKNTTPMAGVRRLRSKATSYLSARRSR